MRSHLQMLVLLTIIFCGAIDLFAQIQHSDFTVVTDTLYPMNMDYWTGTTNGSTKTDNSEVRTQYPELGWMTFDISSIPGAATIDSITLNGFVNTTNFPFWSATPMGTVYPVTDPAADIYSQVSGNAGSGTAYIYSDESYGFIPGWYAWEMGNGAIPDLQAAVASSQGWFAIGIYDRDQAIGYFINFDGWSEANPPYLVVDYEYYTPVELTAFTAAAGNQTVTLNWTTATETNNKGFEIERKSGEGQYQKAGYVSGSGTTTEPKDYTFSDSKLDNGSYIYRLKQVDLNGTFSYSKEVEVVVTTPAAFALAQNYPNPFNPTTVINYELSSSSLVTLKIYNTLGEQVAVLVNEEKPAGSYKVNFDGSNLPSGIYVYKITAGKYSSAKKLILMK